MFSQTTDLDGQVITSLDAENIHIINKTSKKFTITNASGTFVIPSKLNDTIIISSIQHQLVSLVIDAEMLQEKQIRVFLEPLVNMLDEVFVGKVLSGDLLQDVQTVEGEPMTSKKAGIPSYQGKPLTQAERKLKDAGDLDPKLGGSLGGLGASVRLIPIINAISGRAKDMKMYVKLEEKDVLMYHLKSHISEALFADYSLEDNHIMEFMYFTSEQPDFFERCKNKTAVDQYEYLKEKLLIYYDNKCIKSH